MLPNIREHSFRVMEVARFLGEALAEAGFDLYLPLVTVGALLHDLGKTPCLGTLTNHAELGAGILEELGYPHVAQVVREHVHLDGTIMDPRPLREAEVVNYADKRVLHEDGSHPGGALCRPQGALRAHSRGPGPHPGHGSQEPGPWRKNLCALAAQSPGSAPGQWRKRHGAQCAPYDKLFRTALE